MRAKRVIGLAAAAAAMTSSWAASPANAAAGFCVGGNTSFPPKCFDIVLGTATGMSGTDTIAVTAYGTYLNGELTGDAGLLEVTCVAVAPTSVFTNVSCGTLTGGVNGPVAEVVAIIGAADADRTFAFSGKGSIPTRPDVATSGRTSSIKR